VYAHRRSIFFEMEENIRGVFFYIGKVHLV